MVEFSPLDHKSSTVSHSLHWPLPVLHPICTFPHRIGCARLIPSKLENRLPNLGSHQPEAKASIAASRRHRGLFACSPISITMAMLPLTGYHSGIPCHPINPAMVVADASQWVFQRLRYLVRPLWTSSRSRTLALPPEITLMIISHLNDSSTTALALTCRTLYSLCSPRHPISNIAEKEEFLLLLEKDLATHYFCHECVKLHRWHRRWSRTVYPFEANVRCKRGSGNYMCFPVVGGIPYYYARLIMNRHLYGSAHGPPLHRLEQQAYSYRYSDGVFQSMSRHARIVDDQLLVLSVVSMHHSRGDAISLRDRVDSKGHFLCKHLGLSDFHSSYGQVQLPELSKNEAGARPFSTCDQTFGSCTVCLTDYSIEISWKMKEKGYVIDVLSYRQLGDCRSPFHWSWHTMSTITTNEDRRTVRPLEYRPGCVRNRWNSADGGAKRTHAE